MISFTLPPDMHTHITGLGIYHPDSAPTQRVGLKPDLYVGRTIEGIRAARDELLEKALELIEDNAILA